MIYDKVAVPGNSGSASFGKIYFPADCCEPNTYKISKSEPKDEKLSPKKQLLPKLVHLIVQMIIFANTLGLPGRTDVVLYRNGIRADLYRR